MGFAFSEAKVEQAYKVELAHFAKGKERSFTARDGVKLAYLPFPREKPRGSVFIIPGRTEFAGKYTEVAFDLHRAGFRVYVLDLRGQGHSERLLPDPEVGFVVRFKDYADDIDDFVKHLGEAAAPRYLLGHSMGATAGILYLADHPGVFRSAALSAPMLQIRFTGLPEWVVWGLVSALDGIGFGKKYTLGVGPYEVGQPFEENKVTKSRARFAAARAATDGDPTLRLGGPSHHWIREALKGMHAAESAASRLLTPVLVLRAGRDRIVRDAASKRFCKSALHCTEGVFPDSEHEILMERDAIRTPALAAIVQHFSR